MTPGLNSAHWCIRCADAASIGPCLHLSFLPLRGLILRAPITYSSTYSTPPTHAPIHHIQQHSSIHAQFVAVSCSDCHVLLSPANGDRDSPSPGAPFHARRAPLPPAVFLSTISPTAAVPCITRRQSSLWCRSHSRQCHLRGPCGGGEGDTRAGTIGFSDRPGIGALVKIYMESVYSGESWTIHIKSTRMLAISSIIQKSQPLLIER